MGILFAILGLSFLIFFHELGHFLCARLFGVRVLVFSIGFGTKLFSWHYKGTQYTLSAIPLGGYVKLQGEREQNQEETQSNHAQDSHTTTGDSLLEKHPLQKMAIFAAGPLFNFLFAFFVYVAVLSNGVPRYSHEPIVGDVGQEFGAYQYLQKNDKIVSIEGIPIEQFSDISRTLNADTTLFSDNHARVVIERTSPKDDKIHTQELRIPLSWQDDRLILGVSPIITTEYLGVADILERSSEMIWQNITMIYRNLSDLILGFIGIDQLSGVIGITDVSAKAYQVGFVNFILIMAIISVNLGIINLLPIPMVDGGQILFTLYEWITGRQLHERVAHILIAFGLSVIISLMLLGFYNDITRLTSKTP